MPAAAGNHPGHQPGTTQARHLTGQGQLPCAHKGPNFVSVTTAPADAGPGQHQPDGLSALTCRNTTQRDPLRRDERPWHGGGLGFESP